MASYIAAQKGYGPADMGIRLFVDVIGKESILLKPAALSFCVFRFFFVSSFGQAGGSKKRGQSIASACQGNRMFVRSTVHMADILSLRRFVFTQAGHWCSVDFLTPLKFRSGCFFLGRVFWSLLLVGFIR